MNKDERIKKIEIYFKKRGIRKDVKQIKEIEHCLSMCEIENFLEVIDNGVIRALLKFADKSIQVATWKIRFWDDGVCHPKLVMTDTGFYVDFCIIEPVRQPIKNLEGLCETLVESGYTNKTLAIEFFKNLGKIVKDKIFDIFACIVKKVYG